MKIKEMVQPSSFDFQSVSLKEIEIEISSLNSRKSNTFKSIPIVSLKDNVDITGKILHKIFLNEITHCEFPDNLKLADINYPTL